MKGRWVLAVLPCVLSWETLAAENRFFVDETPIVAGADDQVIPLLCDNDQEVLGYSLGLRVDPAKLAVQGIDVSGTVAETADFFDGSQDPAEGTAAYGVVFSMDETIAETQLPTGTDQVIALLIVDVLATDDTTAEVGFESVLVPAVSPLPVTNVMTIVEDNQAVSLSPLLVTGTVPVEDRTPVITSVTENQGREGDTFRVTGEFFDEPGLTVTVCGVEADATLVAAESRIDVVAPSCGTDGFAVVEVCTVRGCASEDEGFFYLPDPLPVITGFENNRGEAGTVFTIVGENFDEGDLTVSVCDVVADAAAPTDGGTRVQVTAPECGLTGAVEVEVCNVFGCASDPAGFAYASGEPLFVRGDTNSDGAINITDAVALLGHLFLGDAAPTCLDASDNDDSGGLNVTDAIVVLQFLFLGEAPPRAPSPPEGRPYESGDCGSDPTPDDSLSCEESSSICREP